MSGADIGVSNILVPDDITINARLTIAPNAVLGQRTVSVATNLAPAVC
jgi:hypothetical protein